MDEIGFSKTRHTVTEFQNSHRSNNLTKSYSTDKKFLPPTSRFYSPKEPAT
jgi:hypothetical protein